MPIIKFQENKEEFMMKKIHLLIAVSIGFTNPSIFGQDSPDFANGVELGQLECEWLSEASGLAAS